MKSPRSSATRPFLLSHHTAEQAERCWSAGSVPICRRCTALWPVAGAVIVLGIARDLPTATVLELAAWLLPALLEYTAVQSGRLAYHPGRTWIFGGLMGLAAGRLLHRFLLDPGDPIAWILGVACGAVGLAANFIRTGSR